MEQQQEQILSLVILAVLACLAVLTIGFEYAKVVVTGAGVVLVAVLIVVLASRFPGAVQPVLKLGRRAMGGLPEDIYADISQITPKFREIVPPFHRQENCIPSAAIRWPDFGDRHALGRRIGQFSRHVDTPRLSF